MDIFTELYRQSHETDSYKMARAQAAALSEARRTFSSFIGNGRVSSDRTLRLSLVDNELKTLTSSVAEQYGVSREGVYHYVQSKLAAEVAVTEPKKVDPKAGIGGAEGKKYQDTEDDGADPDAETDIAEMDAVLEDEPVRHKLKHDDKLDTQADNKPGDGKSTSATDSKAFPNHASRTAAGYSGDDPVTDDMGAYDSHPTYGALIHWLQTSVDPNEPVYPGFMDDFMAEYQSTPEQFEGQY